MKAWFVNRFTQMTEDRLGFSLRTFGRLLSYFSGWWLIAALLGVLVISTSLLATYPIVLIKKVVDTASHQTPGGLTLIIRFSLLFLILQLAAVLTNRTLGLVNVWLEGHLGHRIRMQAFNHVQTLSLNFYESRKTGELLSRLIGDTEITVQGLLAPVTSIARSAVDFAFSLYFMIALDWELTVLCLPAGVIAGTLLVVFGRVLRRRQRLAREAADQLWSRLVDSLRGMRDIQANNQQANVGAQVENISEVVRTRTMSVNLANVVSGGANYIIFLSTIAVMLLFGGYRVWHGWMSYGTLTAFMVYTHKLVDPIADLATFYRQLQKSIVSAERIFRIFDQAPTITDSPDAVVLESPKGEINLRHVSFEYEADSDVLKDVSLHIPAEQRVVLVGPSGGGKTTIVKLLARFYDPAKGQILIDGMDLRDIRLESLRSHLGLLFQDVFLFDGTLDTNIRFGRPEASVEEVEEAARAAGLGELIERLSEGLNTAVGENGVKLSGGERQRVGLARVLLKRPSIVILDEPAASLDTVTTAEIMARLAKELSGRTILIIAHQLSTIVDADLIVVLADGRIVEQGTHEQLYAAGGLYRSMYDAQFVALRARVAELEV